MAVAAVSNLDGVSGPGLINLLGVCALSRTFYPPLFRAAFAHELLRKLYVICGLAHTTHTHMHTRRPRTHTRTCTHERKYNHTSQVSTQCYMVASFLRTYTPHTHACTHSYAYFSLMFARAKTVRPCTILDT